MTLCTGFCPYNLRAFSSCAFDGDGDGDGREGEETDGRFLYRDGRETLRCRSYLIISSWENMQGPLERQDVCTAGEEP